MRGSSPRESAIVRLGILYRVLLYGVIRLSVGQEVVALFRLVRLRHNPLFYIVYWCNGSTPDFGSVSGSSSLPYTTLNIYSRIKGYFERLAHLVRAFVC